MTRRRFRPRIVPGRALALASVLALWTAAASAQSGAVAGAVTSTSGTPLPGVNVRLEGTTRGAATDVGGRYRIPSVEPGAYTVVASAVGFRTERRAVEVDAGATVAVDFALAELVLEGTGVVVTAARRAQQVGTVPVSVSVVGPQEIETRNWVSIDDALRHTPGVQLAGNTVNVRGSSGFAYGIGSRVLLLVDGVPMLGPDQGHIPFEVLPMAQVERIEVLKGPGSALYGGGALGGVVQVLTRDFPDTPETRVRLFGGGYDPVRYPEWRTAWTPADDVRLFGGGTLSHARQLSDRLGFWTNLSVETDPGFLDGSAFTNVQAHAKAGWTIAPGRTLSLFGGALVREREDFLFWQSGRDALIPADTDFLDGSAGNARVEQFNVLPVYTHVFSPRFFTAVRGRYFGTRIFGIDPDGTIDDDGTVAHRFGSEVQGNWNPRPGRYLTFGVTADVNTTTSDFYTGVDADRSRFQPEGAVFAQVEERIRPDLLAIAGVRLDAYRFDETETVTRLSPKFSLSYEALPVLSLRGSFGLGFRAPSIAERFVNSRDYLPVIPNLDLRPEESVGYEIGLKGIVPVGARAGLELDVAGFWNDYRNLVEPTFSPVESAFQFVNLTDARIRGVETIARLAGWNERVAAQASWVVLDARDRSGPESLPLSFRSKHLVQTSITVRPFGPIDLAVDARFAGRPERLDSDFTRFVPDADLMVPIRVVDLRLGARFGGIRAAVLLKNAFDYYYLERPALLAPPRHGLVQLQADF